MGRARSALARGWLLALGATSAITACKRPPPTPAPEPWQVTVREVGAGEPGAQRCDAGGTGCAPLSPGALGLPAALRTQGARATLDVGAPLIVEKRTDVLLEDGAARKISLRSGALTVRAGAAAPPAVQVLGTEVAGGAEAWWSAEVTGVNELRVAVERGRVRLKSGGAEGELLAGDVATLRAGELPDRRAAFGAAPVFERGELDRVAVRGLGTVSARRPGTQEIVSGVKIASHRSRTTITGGVAHTEIEEVMQNDGSLTVEGRYAFAVPPDATLTRLALWVGERLVEGEVVEQKRAAQVFKTIVDDSVRPRDPALLEWVRGSELSLKVFPIEPKKSRRVLVGYDQLLPKVGSAGRFALPLSLGADRAATLDELSVEVAVSGAPREVVASERVAAVTTEGNVTRVSFQQTHAAPREAFVVSWREGDESLRAARSSTPRGQFVALSFEAGLPKDVAVPESVARPRVIALDRSASQSDETWRGQVAAALGILERLDPGERFAVLACDSACDALPEAGLAEAGAAAVDKARTWLAALTLGGATDLAEAAVSAAGRLPPEGGQIVLFGDGQASAGPLAASAIAARARPAIEAQHAEVRVLGAGRTVDELRLASLARELGGSYQRLDDAGALASRVETLAFALRRPLLRDVRLTLPAGLVEPEPALASALALGQAVTVAARVDGAGSGDVVLEGHLQGKPYRLVVPLVLDRVPEATAAAKLWASARLATLDASDAPADRARAIQLSRDERVLSRHTAWLVLESDKMFAEFGIPRTVPLSDPALPGVSMPSTRELEASLLRLLEGSSGPSLNDVLSGAAPGLADTMASAPAKAGTGGLGAPRGAGLDGLTGTGPVADGPVTLRGAVSVSVSASGEQPVPEATRVVALLRAFARNCYERELRANPDARGSVVINWQLDEAGSPTNVSGSGNLPSVQACVLSRARGLKFSASGSVRGVFTFKADELRSQPPRAPVDSPPAWNPAAAQPAVTLTTGDDQWRAQGEDALAKLRAALAAKPESRKAHENLARGLLLRGRFAEALTAARAFAALDPDQPLPRALVAEAAAASGDARAALAALTEQVEARPTSAVDQSRLARAYEAAGQERRACAHWVSASELAPKSDDLRYESLRCRARRGELEAVKAELAAKPGTGKRFAELQAALGRGEAPAYAPQTGGTGWLEAELSCSEGDCPALLVVSPAGGIIAPVVPSAARSGAKLVALRIATDGVYRVLVVGKSTSAELTVRAVDQSRKVSVAGDGTRTALVVQASSLSGLSRFGWGGG